MEAISELTSLQRVKETFKKWLHITDAGGLYVSMATVVANRFAGDPVWLLLVANSSSGKTEYLNALNDLDDMYPVSTLTQASLMCGLSTKEFAEGAKGGLLYEMHGFGIMVVKDFGGILNVHKDSRGAILQALRDIYDGSWTRIVGSEGAKTLNWKGKVGFIGGATPDIDRHHEVMSVLGERFAFYRMPAIDRTAQGHSALVNGRNEAQMRSELAKAVTEYLGAMGRPLIQPSLTRLEEDWLVALANLVTICRSPVVRDSYTREIEDAPGTEAPGRFVKMLAKLLGALKVIGVDDATAYKLVYKVGMDSMPLARRLVVEYLDAQTQPQSTAAVSDAIMKPPTTTDRALEDLKQYGIVIRKMGGQGISVGWKLSQETADMLILARATPS